MIEGWEIDPVAWFQNQFSGRETEIDFVSTLNKLLLTANAQLNIQVQVKLRLIESTNVVF